MKTLPTSTDGFVFTPLGAGREVGRSCFHVSYQRAGAVGAFLMDCGIHPSIAESNSCSDVPALPFFDLLADLRRIDFILLSHFHNDHASGLPSLISALGRQQHRPIIYMTQQTKAILEDNFADNLNQNKIFPQILSEDERRTTAADAIRQVFAQTQFIAFNEQLKLPNNVHVTAYSAGHVLGAAMFNIDLNGLTMLYTGDYSMERDRHLNQADIPVGLRPDVLVTEGTYGTLVHMERWDREREFVRVVESTVKRGGKVLLPVFSVGRVQELLAILDEAWAKNVDLQPYKIYYVSNIGHKYKQNEKFITYCTDDTSIDKNAASVIFCTPGMLQSGVSKRLFEELCDQDKNTLLVTGYGGTGSMLHSVLQKKQKGEIFKVNRQNRGICEVKMQIVEISFSAHSDCKQTTELIKQVQPKNLILIHGSRGALDKLLEKLENDKKKGDFNFDFVIHVPENGRMGMTKISATNTVSAQFLCRNTSYEQFMSQQGRFLLHYQKNGVDFKIVDESEENCQVMAKFQIDQFIDVMGLRNILVRIFGERNVDQKPGTCQFDINILETYLQFIKSPAWSDYRRLRNLEQQQSEERKQLQLAQHDGLQKTKAQLEQIRREFGDFNSQLKVSGLSNTNAIVTGQQSAQRVEVEGKMQLLDLFYLIFHRAFNQQQQQYGINEALEGRTVAEIIKGKAVSDIEVEYDGGRAINNNGWYCEGNVLDELRLLLVSWI